MVETEFERKIKTLRTDWVGEYQSFTKLVSECGIRFEVPIAGFLTKGDGTEK